MTKRTFTQADYNKLVQALDVALSVFEDTSEEPEPALKDFILNHYFNVWRAMA